MAEKINENNIDLLAKKRPKKPIPKDKKSGAAK